MSADDLRFAVPSLGCSSSATLPATLTRWGESFADSLALELASFLEKAKIQAVLDYNTRPRGSAALQVAPFDLSPWSMSSTGRSEISAVPRPPLAVAKTRTTVVAAPAGFTLVATTELHGLKTRIEELQSEIEKLKLALQQEISNHQKTKLLLEARPLPPAATQAPVTDSPAYEISDSLDPVAMTPLAPSSSLRPSTPEISAARAPVATAEEAAQTEISGDVAQSRTLAGQVGNFSEICMHAEFPEQLRRAERELAETQRRMHREFCDVHDEFGNFRRRTFAETESLAKMLRQGEAAERQLQEEAARLEKQRLELQFELDELQTKFRTTVEFAEGVFQELERTKKFESLATEAKNEVYTLKGVLRNLEVLASENQKQISQFNSTFCSAKDRLVSAVRTFTAGFEYKPRPQKLPPATAEPASLRRSPRIEKTARNTFPSLPPVDDAKKKLWRRELEIPDTPRK